MRAIMLSIAIAASAATLGFAAGPAMASTEACAAAPAKLRSIAATADAEAQRKAERNISLGEALCDARNRAEAAKKFNLAAKALGTELATVMASETTAAVQ